MLTFREMTLDELETYHARVGAALQPDEHTPPDDYRELREKRKYFRSWILYDTSKPDEWVGYCAMLDPVSITPHVHIYGTVIFAPHQGKGLSKLLYEHCFATCRELFPGRDMSISIRPTNIKSMGIAIKNGFMPYSFDQGFINMARKVA